MMVSQPLKRRVAKSNKSLRSSKKQLLPHQSQALMARARKRSKQLLCMAMLQQVKIKKNKKLKLNKLQLKKMLKKRKQVKRNIKAREAKRASNNKMKKRKN
jgi:hypothetical protein